jgi:hypothetical protein
MRITYRTLAKLIDKMSDEQKDSDVTVEIQMDDECYAAELRICDDNHDSLDEDHPVLFVPEELGSRSDDIDVIWANINGIYPGVRISDT